MPPKNSASSRAYSPRPARGGDSASTGSRSPKHRGYRPEDASGAHSTGDKKARWSADDRRNRTESVSRSGRSGAPARGAAGGNRFGGNRDADARGTGASEGRREWYPKGERPGQRGPRPAWSPERRGGSAGGERGYGRDDRRDDRSARGYDRADRAPRAYGDRDSRPARDDRGYDRRDDRPRSDRPYGTRDDRPARSYGARDARPARSYDRDERAPRAYGDRDARPVRSYGDRDARPARSFDRDDRPARRFDRGDRPARSYSDRDARPAGRPEIPEDIVLDRLEAQAVDATTAGALSFGALGLGQNIERVLAELGAEQPFPIQAATIPEVLTGRDVLGRGRTGSGKTIAFGAPVVELLLRGNEPGARRTLGRKPRALILAPTRELALQIDRTVQPIARSVGLFTTQIYGGVPQARQVGALQRGVDIIIGTPGRIEDLVAQGRLDLSGIEIVVLDEADHMCDLGFLEPVQRIIRLTKEGGQRLLFSATLDSGVANLVEEFLTEPAVYEVAGEDQASSTIEHRLFVVEQRDKIAIVEKLADRDGKTLVFARTRAFAEQLAEILEDAGIPAVSLHGDLNQARRTRNLEKLTSGRVRVLVATDVAARGIHVDDVDLVVQADIPEDYKTYLHRAGRTGRAGKHGTVVTLVTKPRLRKIGELLRNAEIDAAQENVHPDSDAVLEIAGR